MSKSNNGRRIHFLENFPILASVGKFLQRSAENRDGNLATLVRVNKATWQSKEELYRQLVPSFDMVYTPLWKKLVETRLYLDRDCVASASDLFYFEIHQNVRRLSSTSGFSMALGDSTPSHLATSQDGSHIALTLDGTLRIYKPGTETPLLEFRSYDRISNLKFIHVAESTLLYVFFNTKIDIYNVSSDGVVLLKTFRSFAPFQVFKAGNMVVILENDFVQGNGAQITMETSTVVKQNDPFGPNVAEDESARYFMKFNDTFEIHDEHILVLSNEPKLYIMNLNNTQNHFDDPFPVPAIDDILCVQAFLADDKSAWGKQVCILDHLNICFFFQRGVEMISFRRIANFQLHHSLPSPVQTIRVTSKEGKTIIHVILLEDQAYYNQEI